ncbi:hypothetical protein MauCBS54593_004248 [Microsporum audouinii]
MSKAFRNLRDAIVKEGQVKKFFKTHTPGSRIWPPRLQVNDEKLQFRIDAGEIINGMKNIYLQVNSQAKNDALRKFLKKHGAHGNIGVARIKENTK